MVRKIGKYFFYLGYLLLVVLFLLELIFRIYNPFHFSVKGNVIILESNTQKKIINDSIPGIEREIDISRNAIGFRGPQPPANLADYLSIITIGGSTTECKYISDFKTWPDLLAKLLSQTNNRVWLNNAGLSGHTTFGHQVLLNDHVLKLKPKIVVFMFGANDLALQDTSIWDKNYFINRTNSWKDFLLKKTETGNIIINLWRARKAKVNNLTDRYYDLQKAKKDTISFSSEYFTKELQKQEYFLPFFERRVNNLIDSCEKHQILPVLITQPVMLGKGLDSVSGADLTLLPVTAKINGILYYQMLELYNNVTRRVAAQRGLLLIDLSKKLQKGGKYFYDVLHYNLEGNKQVASLIFAPLDSMLATRFPTFRK